MATKKPWVRRFFALIDHKDEKTVHNLRRFPPFEAIPDKDIQALAKQCHIRHFSSDEEVFAESSPSAAIYFITYGSIGLYKKRRSKQTDRVQVVQAGNFFGESSLIHNNPRTHSAKALEKTQVIVLFQSDYESLQLTNPKLALLILKLVTTKISKELLIFQTEFHELSQKIARDQLLD